MLKPWRFLLDTLWPQPGCQLEQIGANSAGVYLGTRYLLPYKNQTVKAAIRNNKFHHHQYSAMALAQSLDTFLQQYSQITIIPIPSSRARWRERGYYALETILHHTQVEKSVRTDILSKTINTPSQSHVDKTTRLSQQRNTFTCDSVVARNLSGTIILFDDVVTTGATMEAARFALQPHLPAGTRLICVALAH